MALALAVGLWRRERARRFRILVLAPSRELSSAWLDKLAPVGRERKAYDDIWRVAPAKSGFFAWYVPEFRKGNTHVSIYSIRTSGQDHRLQRWSRRPETQELRHRRGKSKIEILVTSPGFLTRQRGPSRWRAWAAGADLVIADEVFGAKNAATCYGRLLAPTVPGASRIFRNRRPWLVALSATILSRDMDDARKLVERLIDWEFRSTGNARRSRLVSSLYERCATFNRELNSALKAGGSSSTGRKAYIEAKESLEAFLRHYMSRVPPARHRAYEIWTTHRRRSSFQPYISHKQFPFPNLAFDSSDLLDHIDVKGLEGDLATFLKASSTDSLKEEHRGRSRHRWLRLTELDAGQRSTNGDGPSAGIKMRSLSDWLKQHFERLAATPSSEATPRFKVLVYCHHVDTARSVLSRTAQSNLNEQLKPVVRNLWRSLLRKDRVLFPTAALSHPHPKLASRLARIGLTPSRLEQLPTRNAGLLIAGLMNASRERTLKRKINAFVRSVEDHSQESAEPAIVRFLRRNLGLRARVLREFGAKRLSDRTERTPTRDKKRRAELWQVFDNPQVRAVLSDFSALREDVELFNSIGRLDLRSKAVSDLSTRLATHLQLDRRSRRYLWRWNWSLRALQRDVRRFKDERMLSHQRSRLVEVLTGENAERRVPVTKEFLTPGNPLVLVLTNVCAMGVDLHHYCWDVIHYSPSWTPSEFEQKSGRIDRPRTTEVRRKLQIGPTRLSNHIRIHHLVWPFTYDERILRRMNLRGHLAERLLASRRAVTATDEVARQFSRLPPLALAP